MIGSPIIVVIAVVYGIAIYCGIRRTNQQVIDAVAVCVTNTCDTQTKARTSGITYQDKSRFGNEMAHIHCPPSYRGSISYVRGSGRRTC